jgi:hypothetical protein
VAAASGAAVASLVPGAAQGASKRRRYAIVGTGVRGVGMWGRPLVERYSDVLEFVGLCDVNPLRVEAARKAIGASCPSFTSLDAMLDQAKPELLMVTTVDATHEGCIVTALERGVDVLTEKPMVVDELQCQAVLDAEKRTGRKIGACRDRAPARCRASRGSPRARAWTRRSPCASPTSSGSEGLRVRSARGRS